MDIINGLASEIEDCISYLQYHLIFSSSRNQMLHGLSVHGIQMVTNHVHGRNDGKALDGCDVVHSGMDGHNVGDL